MEMSASRSIKLMLKNRVPRFDVPGMPGFTLPFPVIGMWYTGVWPMNRTWKNQIYTAITIASMTMIVTGEALYCVKVWGDIGAMCEIVATTVEGVRDIFLAVRFLWKSRQLAKIIEKFSTEVWISRVVNEKDYLAAEKHTFVTNCIAVAIFGSMLSKCIFPYLTSMNAPMDERLFPFDLDFPFPFRLPTTYHLFYFMCIHIGWACVFCVIAHSALFNYMIVYTCVQLSRLCHRIMETGVDNADDEVVAKALAGAVEEHNRLIEFVSEIEDLFSPNMLFQFIVTSILVCVLGIQILLVDVAPAKMVEELMFFIAGLGQMYLVCNAGQQLIDSGYQVGDAAYNFNWVDVNKKYHMYVVMIIQRSQRPLQITAYKFFALSMESFSSVCSTAGSYFALLKTLMEE